MPRHWQHAKLLERKSRATPGKTSQQDENILLSSLCDLLSEAPMGCLRLVNNDHQYKDCEESCSNDDGNATTGKQQQHRIWTVACAVQPNQSPMHG
jgi:hypothetical protein